MSKKTVKFIHINIVYIVYIVNIIVYSLAHEGPE